MSFPRLAGITFAWALLATAGMAMASPQSGMDADAGLGLNTAWQLTQKNYPRYQAAVSGREAGQAYRALGRAGMLPHLSAQFRLDQNWGEKTEPGRNGQQVTTDLDYTSWENRVTLSQTVFNWTKINAWRQGDAKADRSQAVFHNKVRSIAMRLVKRYLQVLLTQQNLALAEKNLKADTRHVEIARHLYQGGEGTITDVQEAKAQRARAYAELQKARSSLAIAQRKLQAMTGRPPQTVHGLKAGFKSSSLQPNSLAAWVARAQENNVDIRVARRNVRVAAREVDKAIGHVLPSLELSASYSRNHSQSLSLLGVDSEMTSVGAQLKVPIFAGGKNWARIEQTRYKYQQARQQLAATRERVAVKVTRQYLGVVSGAEHIEALKKAVQTAEQTLEAVRKSYQAGTRSISDILETQEQLHEVRLDLAKARLDYVKSRIKLKVVASSLNAEAIVATASQWFGAVPVERG